MRYQGKISEWKDDQGYGFIIRNGDRVRTFVHIKSFPGSRKRPGLDDRVTYEIGSDAKGRAQARNVTFLGERSQSTFAHVQNWSLLLMTLYLLIVAAAAVTGHLPIAVPTAYIVLSVMTFVAYANDKSAAKNDTWRTPEATLHLLAVLGGWPGAVVAQRVLRHKSKKQSFQTTFWITVVLNCAALGWLMTVPGNNALWAVLAAVSAVITP